MIDVMPELCGQPRTANWLLSSSVFERCFDTCAPYRHTKEKNAIVGEVEVSTPGRGLACSPAPIPTTSTHNLASTTHVIIKPEGRCGGLRRVLHNG